MDNEREVSDFLTSRRARVTPEMAGIPAFGRKRRVPGLRREEIAMLAGMSTDYYVRIERGNLKGVSQSVLDAVARTLQLTDAELGHLYDLARVANEAVLPHGRPANRKVPHALQRMIDRFDAPTWIRSARADFVAGNALGTALFAPIFVDPRRPANTARFTFLDPRAADFFPDWDEMARGIVAGLRSEAGRNPRDRELTELVGELTTRSELFAQLWAAHDVYEHRSGEKRIDHPDVGLLELTYESLDVVSVPGLRVLVYDAAEGSRSAEGLQLLANLATTAPPVGSPADRGRPA